METTVYIPAANVVAPVIVGFCVVDVNEFGPDQLYVAAVTVLAFRLRFWNAQIGELFDAIGACGVGFIVTLITPAGLVHPRAVAVTE
jgi:hypothetical protein